MPKQKFGEYSYVTPEDEAEKKLQDKKHPKDRLLSVERVQKYEVTLQDMFTMRLHYKQEALQQLKNAVEALRDYRSAMTQVKTWEEQILKAFEDIPELKTNNEIPEDQLVVEEQVKEFDGITAQLEGRFNEISSKPLAPDGADENLEDKK